MTKKDNNYSSDFKAEIAKKALEQDKKNLDSLSNKYDVPVSKILFWTSRFEQEGEEAFKTVEEQPQDDSGEQIKDEETVDVDVNDERVAESLSYGVMGDKLNYKRLIFWSVLGIILVLIFVVALIEMYQYNTQISRDRISEQSEYYQVNQLHREAEDKLSSFGVVDPEEGIYRIPIDSAMNEIAVDGKK